MRVNKKNVRILVSGLVQGVGYRAWLKETAEVSGVTGWTRNLRDGQVEAMLVGPAEMTKQVIELARRGPRNARVDDVTERRAHADECALGLGSFRILPDA